MIELIMKKSPDSPLNTLSEKFSSENLTFPTSAISNFNNKKKERQEQKNSKDNSNQEIKTVGNSFNKTKDTI